MKNKPGKYLKFYSECMVTGELPYSGLCDSLGDIIDLLFLPSRAHPKYKYGWYWAHGEKYTAKNFFDMSLNDQYRFRTEFTPLRQNIVLFLAAMNGEL